MQNGGLWIAAAAAVAAVVWPLVYLLAKRSAARLLDEARREATKQLESAERDAEAKRREADLAAKEKLLQARSEFEKASRARREELEALEKRLAQKEDTLDKRLDQLTSTEKDVSGREKAVAGRERAVETQETELQKLIAAERSKLEHIAGLTATQAKDELVRGMESEARMEAAHIVKRIEDEARENAGKQAQRIIGMAVQRSASDYVSETAVSVVMLPSDEMKGRIIGREGRNIRALETATGVDLIVDDTPEAVILSGFDPFRREIARVALERLIQDGRIHPGAHRGSGGEGEVGVRPEASAKRARRRSSSSASPTSIPSWSSSSAGCATAPPTARTCCSTPRKSPSWPPPWRPSSRSNVRVAKRGGLFHDIGKAIDREMDGTHLQIGIDLLRKYGESEAVVHAMACHHGDYEPETVEAVLVTAADALSAARPGARREVLETYVKRLEKLEEIASSFKGVQKTFAIQAGREIRIIVDCGKISDEEAVWLSKDMAKKIESELTYPGQIKVTVIRETRAVEYAK